MKQAWQHRYTALLILTIAALLSVAFLAHHQHSRLATELAELKTAAPVLAACPIPPLDSPQSLIIWRTRDGIGGEEIRCAHGRIRAADPRAVGPARPGSAS